MNNFVLYKFFACAVIAILVLNPYTVIGRPAIFLSALFMVYAFRANFLREVVARDAHIYLSLIVISLIGIVSSIIHGIEQYTHLYGVLSWITVIWVGVGLFTAFNYFNWNFDEFVRMIFFGLLFNSFIVVLELLFPTFRQLVESLLKEAGNRFYDDGFRFRGLAASGGANLSLTIPSAVALALHLYSKKLISSFAFFLSICLLIFSATVIGRTGLLMLPVPFILYVFYHRELIFVGAGVSRNILLFVGLIVIAPALYFWASDYLALQFGDAFVKYSFGFLLEGESGLKDEGTIDVIREFLSVVPRQFPETIFGYGFYGGSDFSPWTDSGYARMFLYVGYFFALIFYVLLLRWFYVCGVFTSFPIVSILIVLLLSETKEPFLISGYSSRVVVFLSIFLSLETAFKRFAELRD